MLILKCSYIFIFVLGDVKTEDSLEYITESLAKFTQFSSCRPLATLNYASDICNGSSIVSRYVKLVLMKDPARSGNSQGVY